MWLMEVVSSIMATATATAPISACLWDVRSLLSSRGGGPTTCLCSRWDIGGADLLYRIW